MIEQPHCWEPKTKRAYVREYPQEIWSYMVQYLHFRILKFPLTQVVSSDVKY